MPDKLGATRLLEHRELQSRIDVPQHHVFRAAVRIRDRGLEVLEHVERRLQRVAVLRFS
jgi:hypothetical protein